MKMSKDWLEFRFRIDWYLLWEIIKCKILGYHVMDWENDDGEIHCFCYKKTSKNY